MIGDLLLSTSLMRSGVPTDVRHWFLNLITNGCTMTRCANVGVTAIGHRSGKILGILRCFRLGDGRWGSQGFSGGWPLRWPGWTLTFLNSRDTHGWIQ